MKAISRKTQVRELINKGVTQTSIIASTLQMNPSYVSRLVKEINSENIKPITVLSVTMVSTEEVRQSIENQRRESLSKLTVEDKEFINTNFKFETMSNRLNTSLVMFRFQVSGSVEKEKMAKRLVKIGLATFHRNIGWLIHFIPDFYQAK